MKGVLSLFLFFLLFTSNCFGFNLSVKTVTETCSGNGVLNFAITNQDSNGSIVFYIYKLPDTNVPIATITSNSLTGLFAGDYLVIAKETVGSITTSQQQNATITNSIAPLTYAIKTLNQACSTTSNISIDISTGNPNSYQIISGPLLFPAQSGNTFNGLPVGTYKVKVLDVCGNSVVQTFTVTLNPTDLNISQPNITNLIPIDCNKVKVTQTISSASGTVIGYPLNIQYQLNVPSSPSPIFINKIISSGNLTSQDVSVVIPNYSNQSYPYTITITDACGTTYPASNFQISPKISLVGSIVNLDCDKYNFKLTANNFSTSYTIFFLSAPAGFVPVNFNSSYPGPFTINELLFGSNTNVVPFGNYVVSITDTCGNTTTTTFNVVSIPPSIVASAAHNGCLTDNGWIHLEIPNYKIVTAVITAAPASYPFPIPNDITASIDPNSMINLNPMPLGNYTIKLTDNCNDTLPPVNITVPVYTDQGISTDFRPGCDLDKTSIKITSNNGKLTSVIITAAPAGFGYNLPHDFSNNITNYGAFYMDNLPSGNYTFSTIDECGFTSQTNLTLVGYTITSNVFSLETNCGSFNIPLKHTSNGNANESFWLQKQLPSGAWGNPISNITYTEGTVPNNTNSLSIANNTTNYNLTFNGTFRIIHSFSTFNNGSDFNNGTVSSIEKNCIEILSPTLSFNQVLEIVDVYRMACNPSGSLDVVVIANGAPPLKYSIIDSNGTVIFDNGSNHIFSNLAAGIYRFQVEDSCGNSVNSTFDVSKLLSLATINIPCDMAQCVDVITGNESFNLSSQNSTILGNQSPSKYTLSYHTSLNEAQTGINPIQNFTDFIPTSNPQNIYIRLIYNLLPNCYQTGNFTLLVNKNPKLKLLSSYLECNTNPVTLNASYGNPPSTVYLWSNGDTTPTTVVSQIGENNLIVTASNVYTTCNNIPLACSTTKEVKVTLTPTPTIDHIETQDWTENNNSITVITAQEGVFEYSIDGTNYQDNNQFTGLLPGIYTVYVRDVKGCKTVDQTVALLDYPRFFTPNGDGYNENWYIKNSEFEPNLKVYIFDRYGKMLTSFNSNSTGWDGIYNGKLMYSDDYWFEVYRQDGKIFKGHFTLKR